MMGMKKPPIAASVSIRPVAVPMYWCAMSQTRAGTASQAANPKMRKNPIPIPSTQSTLAGTTGMRTSSAATAMSGPTMNIRKFLLRSAQYPPSRLPGTPESAMSADSRPPAVGSKCRWVVTYSLNSCEVVKYARPPLEARQHARVSKVCNSSCYSDGYGKRSGRYLASRTLSETPLSFLRSPIS